MLTFYKDSINYLLLKVIFVKKYTKIYKTKQKYINIYNMEMKAKEVLEKFKISRNTLTNWVKKELIKVKLTPSGRYIYIIEDKDKNN